MLLPPGPSGAPGGAWFCPCPLPPGCHQDRRPARRLAPPGSPAGSRSLRDRRAASALPQTVYPDAHRQQDEGLEEEEEEEKEGEKS